MPGKEYECKDCGRAFQVYQDEKKVQKCPSCDGENVALKQAQPLPSWLLSKNLEGSS
jgi:putative FmdB family regulatory protein